MERQGLEGVEGRKDAAPAGVGAVRESTTDRRAPGPARESSPALRLRPTTTGFLRTVYETHQGSGIHCRSPALSVPHQFAVGTDCHCTFLLLGRDALAGSGKPEVADELLEVVGETVQVFGRACYLLRA